MATVTKNRSASGPLAATWPEDLIASVVVFLVALPLCLGIAVASGAPPITGLVTGIIGGIVVGILAGSPLQVSGPAAGLVALVAEIIAGYGMQGLGLILIFAGALQSLAGLLKLGQWFRAISPAVVQGMLAGIGILIVGGQFHVMLDVTPESNGLANLGSIPDTVAKGMFPLENATHHWAALIGAISLLVIVLWNFLPSKLKLIPGSLMAVIAGAVIAQWVDLPIRYVELPGSIAAGLTLPTLNSFELLADAQVWLWIVTIAIVASAETMLSVTAVDQMQDGPRSNYDREMLAQGVGNALCGLVGALPLTGVILRSSANVRAGAQTRWSAILHGIWLLGLVGLFPRLLALIPTASLAAILVYTGLRLVSVSAIRRLWAIDKADVLVYGVTLVMVVSTNLLEGVIVGSIVAILKLLYTLSNLTGESVEHADGSVSLYLRGSATFLSLPKLVTILEHQPPGRHLTIYIDALNYFDHSCMDALQALEHQYNLSGGILTIEWQTLQDKLPGGKKYAGAPGVLTSPH